MGKYTKLRGTLPARPLETEGGFAAAVAEKTAEYRSLDTKALVAEFLDQRRQKDAIEDSVKPFNVRIEALNRLLTERMIDEGDEKKTTAEGVTLYLSDEPQCKVDDRAKLFAWIKRNKAAYLLNVQWQTLNALVKECLITKGKKMPQGVSATMLTRVKVLNGKGNEEE